MLGLEPYEGVPPQVWVAAHGPRMLKITGRLADGWLPTNIKPDAYATKLTAIREAAETPPDQWPEALPEPLPPEASPLLKKLRAVGQAEAERLGMAPELMLRKKHLEALLKSGFPDGPYSLPDGLRGWRRELMGQALLDTLATAGQ